MLKLMLQKAVTGDVTAVAAFCCCCCNVQPMIYTQYKINSHVECLQRLTWSNVAKMLESQNVDTAALKALTKRKKKCFAFLPNICMSVYAHPSFLLSVPLSVLRCNTWASWKKHESSWGKCLLICFRFCFIAVSSLTSSMNLPSQTEGSLYL